uniref:Rhodanese domain-containing protein n=1 Tax=Glossina brevipalpis TaxID=37001 RepID=A0A1A9X1B5_9MUSC
MFSAYANGADTKKRIITLSNSDCANDYAVDDNYEVKNDNRQKNRNQKLDNAKQFYYSHKLPADQNYTWTSKDNLSSYKQSQPIATAIKLIGKPKDIRTDPSELTMTNRLLLRHFLRNPTLTNELSLRNHFPYLLYPDRLHRHLEGKGRGMATKGDAKVGVADYTEVKELPFNPDKLLIDVREPEELHSTGRIPTSVNIPLGRVYKELQRRVDATEFRKRYGRKKPDFDTCLIFHCKEGFRAGKAAEQALSGASATVKNELLLDAIAKSSPSFVNWFSSSGSIPIVVYKEVKELPKHPEKLLVDVREPNELRETGQIPTSVNIPLNKVAQEFHPDLDESIFKAKYGRDKPKFDTVIIFHCKIGKRSQNAAEILQKLGYQNKCNFIYKYLLKAPMEEPAFSITTINGWMRIHLADKEEYEDMMMNE